MVMRFNSLSVHSKVAGTNRWIVFQWLDQGAVHKEEVQGPWGGLVKCKHLRTGVRLVKDLRIIESAYDYFIDGLVAAHPAVQK